MRGYGPIDPRRFSLAQRPLTGTTDPAIAPRFVGQSYINTASGKVFQAVGTSLDSWRVVSSSVIGLGLWVLGGDLGTLSTSPDYATWTTRTSTPLDTSTSRIRSFAYANDLLVAVGHTASNGEGKILATTDGITWSDRTPAAFVGTSKNLTHVTYTDRWVAIGESGTYLTSTDNTATWTVNTPIPDAFGSGIGFFDFGGALLYFSNVFEDYPLYRSTNGGATWTGRYLADYFQLAGVASNGSRLVAFGESKINYSDNGTAWSSAVKPTLNTLNTIEYGGNVFVIAGNGGAIITSTDNGETWTNRTPVTTENLYGLGYYAGTWLAVGTNSTLISSVDNGATWALEPSPVSGALRSLNSIIHA